jgi:hypothetical protein
MRSFYRYEPEPTTGEGAATLDVPDAEPEPDPEPGQPAELPRDVQRALDKVPDVGTLPDEAGDVLAGFAELWQTRVGEPCTYPTLGAIVRFLFPRSKPDQWITRLNAFDAVAATYGGRPDWKPQNVSTVLDVVRDRLAEAAVAAEAAHRTGDSRPPHHTAPPGRATTHETKNNGQPVRRTPTGTGGFRRYGGPVRGARGPSRDG